MIYLQLDKIKEYWEQLQAELKKCTLELETWALKPREGHFYARGVSDRIFIEGKSVKGIRSIAYPEFEKVAKHYNDYIANIPSIKEKLRSEVGYNTQYILTLIHYILEKPQSSNADEDDESTNKKDETERKKRSKSRW